MTNIGTFTRNDDGSFDGEVIMLQANFKARLEPLPERTDKGPHFRVFAGRAEVGAGWERTSERTGEVYVSVKLDDPSFTNAVYANLVSNGGGNYDMIWSRARN